MKLSSQPWHLWSMYTNLCHRAGETSKKKTKKNSRKNHSGTRSPNSTKKAKSPSLNTSSKCLTNSFKPVHIACSMTFSIFFYDQNIFNVATYNNHGKCIYVTVPSPQTQRENVLYSVTPIKGEIISKFSK